METVETSLQWFAHVMKMVKRIRKLIMETFPDSVRGKGRPRLEWVDDIEKINIRMVKTLLQIKCFSLDRRDFRK